MCVSRATLGLAMLAAMGCGQQRTVNRDATPASARDATVRSDPHPHVTSVADASDRIRRAVHVGYPDAPMTAPAFDQWMAELRPDDPAEVRAAYLLAAVRRAPSERLPRVWSAARLDELPALMRGLAARSSEAGPVELPIGLRSPDAVPDLALATVVARLHPAFVYTASQDGRLVAASLEDQLAAARLLAASGVPWPMTSAVELTSPVVWPAIARSMSARGSGLPTDVWVTALTLTGGRCRIAPRLWCNAWRAVRDAAPRIPPVDDALRTTAAAVDTASLPGPVASSLRCENAIVIDRMATVPEATLRCALPGSEWIASAAQATAWGSSRAPARARLAALQAIRSTAHGQPEVLEAVCEAALQVPAALATPLLRSLAADRDPGVLAALLAGLLLHVQHARLLSPPERVALERTPFELPEGPALEARQHALELARLMGDPLPGPPGSTRALQQAWLPDAGRNSPPRPSIVGETRPRVLRFVLDFGSFDLQVDPSQAPEAAAAILTAARIHRYDGLTFHRVIPGFVAQGLDPRGDGYGGTDQPTATELSTRRFERSTVGIPLAGQDTGGIQLFIVLADAPHLDGRYPWLGRITRGMDVVDGVLPRDHVVRVETLEP